MQHADGNIDGDCNGNVDFEPDIDCDVDIDANQYTDGNADRYAGDIYTVQLDHLYGGRVAGGVHNYYAYW